MGADQTLVRGAYYAAGGGIDTNPRNYFLDAFSNVITLSLIHI